MQETQDFSRAHHGHTMAAHHGGAPLPVLRSSVWNKPERWELLWPVWRAAFLDKGVVTVHVPKAGGTALAGLARRIACAKNPQIAHLNPCCIQDFCADHRTYPEARAR